MFYQDEFELKTKGENDIVDITNNVREIIAKSGVKNGIANIFVVGSTGAVTTMEYEPGLKKDLALALARIAPNDIYYYHHEKWGDDNGRSHVKASIIGPSITVPIRNGELILGTWQQIVFLELDTRPRVRKIIVSVLGEY
ncbi:MAG: secondary thiamine-phosphate synthase enzyme YjbQ [Crenarchaeota archaeon]|nr:secondary thiamine-phosphate synthase enzyme YjbQ [Thermoproteota archaeon]MCR8454516.1 secondary thiamine-phosphate synthase enzyme YjbQ [Thermoproteota archaeon]MCR8455783.1 secondary thiamine-phosphate synthase enzyme YjbQ [Thermoproteota archaeon]MCR8470588.1 secondary thiamine-phosphate synthase enzyme YjbQ [Thermoproteota archaeon]MCR8472324.1 secondary thiamine-phosphate synthase enzyme YjbQ [Thermoproteota archaeon]